MLKSITYVASLQRKGVTDVVVSRYSTAFEKVTDVGKHNTVFGTAANRPSCSLSFYFWVSRVSSFKYAAPSITVCSTSQCRWLLLYCPYYIIFTFSRGWVVGISFLSFGGYILHSHLSILLSSAHSA